MTPKQCKAARELLGWTQVDLAAAANVAVSTLADFEREEREPVTNNMRAMRRALETAGVAFINEYGRIGVTAFEAGESGEIVLGRF